jgi:hypothetical protein
MLRDATAVSSDRCPPAGVENRSLPSAASDGPVLVAFSGSAAGRTARRGLGDSDLV